jgi:hypothetical protein
VANPASRFDFMWPGGQRVITQPAPNHNGGNMVFGPDGYLYIGMGDGGGGIANQHRAQDPNTLLGKMLRLDVSVPDANTRGYQIPFDNPFVDNHPVPALDEIWAFGLRNPWRWSFDLPSLGGTGAMLIGDVGEDSWEEIDYQPPGRGARNYGWRNRQGAHDFVTTLPPAYTPLVNPIFEYSHAVGASVTAGYVYRGRALGGAYVGRFFFADIVGKVWSLKLAINPTTEEATASNLQEHTAALGGAGTLGAMSSFGVDSRGELYLVSLSRGIVFKVLNRHPEKPRLAIDTPKTGASVAQPFQMLGWAIDEGVAPGQGTGVDFLRVQAFAIPGTSAPVATFTPDYGLPHPPIGALFGAQFTNSGYRAVISGLVPGRYRLEMSVHSTVTNSFVLTRSVEVTVTPPFTRPRIAIDTPRPNATVGQPVLLAGWALDQAATIGTGIDQVRILISAPGSFARTSVGAATFFPRPDVGAIFGANFDNCGWLFILDGVLPGTYDVTIEPRSTITGSSAVTRTIRLTLTD